jgi:hypothetical protein
MGKTIDTIHRICADGDCVEAIKEWIAIDKSDDMKASFAGAPDSLDVLISAMSNEVFERMEVDIISKRPELATLFSEPTTSVSAERPFVALTDEVGEGSDQKQEFVKKVSLTPYLYQNASKVIKFRVY